MRTPGSRPRELGLAAAALAVVALVPHFAAAAPNDITGPLAPLVNATPSGTAHVIEWDLTSLPDQLDLQAGAVSADTRGEDHNQLWFVSRVPGATDTAADGQRIYRVNPPESLLRGDASWTSWGLRIDTFAGGLERIRASHDRRFVFARSAQYVQRIDTQSCYPGSALVAANCERVVWSFPGDEFIFVSDIAADNRNRVFTTGVGAGQYQAGYVQMLDSATVPVKNGTQLLVPVKRWFDLLGAGACESIAPIGSVPQTLGASFLCNAGIDVHPGKQQLVYFVEQGADNHGYITELNTANVKPGSMSPNLRRWSLLKLGQLSGDTGIAQPRMLRIDRSGKIWINTGSGHLVSLDPGTNRMTKHLLPEGASNDPWAVAPDDDVIGYTGANTNKVAMMFPKSKPVTVQPIPGVSPIAQFMAVLAKERSAVVSGSVPGHPKIVATRVTSNTDGLFIEGFVNTGTSADPLASPVSLPSMIPLGITANRSKAQGSFFYTVGAAGDINSFAKRLGHIRLPMKDKAKFPRDDDDADDGFDRHRNPKWHNSEPGDDDADAVPNAYDTATARENMTLRDPAPLAAGQTASFQVATKATSVAIIASVLSDKLTAIVAIDVYNSIGTLVGTSGPVAGLATVTVPAPGAGAVTVRVRNMSAVTIMCTPTVVVREPPTVLP
jgi:hypothetical protein